MTTFSTFKTMRGAQAAAKGKKPIISIGNVYLVANTDDMLDMKLTEISLLWPVPTLGDPPGYSNRYVGNVTLGHLARLGNANWAEATRPYTGAAPDWQDSQ